MGVTSQAQVWFTVPFSFMATALTFQVPGKALVLVYVALVTLALNWSNVPFRYHVIFTVWLSEMLNDLVAVSVSVTGEVGE